MSGTVWILGTVAVAIGLIAIAVRRREPWTVRAAGFGAVLIAWSAATNRQEIFFETEPPHVVAVTTGDGDLSDLARRVRAIDGARLDRVVSTDPSRSVAVLAARRDSTSADVVLVWTDTFEPGETASLAGVRGPFWTTPPAPIEPGDFEVRALAPWRVDRPAALELRATRELPPETRVVVTLRDAAGRLAEEREVDGGELRSPRELPFALAVAGEHRVELEARVGATRVRAEGAIAVAPPPVVGVLGADAAVVVAALVAQGIDARAVEDLSSLEKLGVVVALGALDAEAQTRLVDFVDRGGGLLVSGAEGGGALPQRGEPLFDWVPVEVLPQPEVAERTDGAAGPDGEPGPETRPPDPDPDEVPPTKPEETGDAATGDVGTPGAPDAGSQKVEVERRQVALVLVIDQSGSMSELVDGGFTRMDYAKRSAFDTARELAVGDLLGVVGFSGSATDVVPLGPVPGLGELRRRLETLSPRRTTRIHAGLARAAEWLDESTAPVRHAVIITDGERLGPHPVDLERTQSLAQKLAQRGVTVSVLHVSKPGDDVRFAPYSRMAKLGRGAFHRTRDASQVPRLLIAEVRRVTGGGPGTGADDPSSDGTGEPATGPPPQPDPPTDPPPKDPPAEVEVEPDPPPAVPDVVVLEVRAVSDSQLVEPVPDDGYPTLSGMAAVAGARADAQVLLVAGERGLPLLAFANRGLGRIAAWTADWTGAWSADWRDEPQFPARLAQWVSYLLPAAVGAPPGAICADGRLTPAAPTRAEIAALEAATGRPAAALETYHVPETRRVEKGRGRAVDDALWAVAAAFLLAIVEFVARRL